MPVERFQILVEATRMALRLAEYKGQDIILEDRSFNKFFVRNSVAPIGGRWTVSRTPTHRSITTYCCRPGIHSTGLVGGEELDVSAINARTLKGCLVTLKDAQERRWTIVFCDKFFTDRKYLNEILNGPKLSEADLGSEKYVSYEQVILHEKIYGMSEARDYAWKFMSGSKMHINQKVVANDISVPIFMETKTKIYVVENYVWYFVDKIYGQKWGWTGTGNAYPGRAPEKLITNQDDAQADTIITDLGIYDTNAANIPAPAWPANCHGNLAIDDWDGRALVCDYVKPPYDDSVPATTGSHPTETFAPPSPPPPPPPVVTLPPDPKNCHCDESGCTKESPACCANGTC
ncbi:hypothetical protein CJF31_00006061 [Rutstroemia sp. NJR-2017a BVV2]|nr:hypothetical protein CJF31_00010187 [Rutstroemia sp. NJR-2017a BVV2]PQE25205.1 hypothetical protein CJF31_00006061 [Rutstroemia sp. NJR-2017a BVV2]